LTKKVNCVTVEYKPPKNPVIDELTKSHHERSYPVGRLDWPKRDDGSKGCIWCGDKLKSTHHMTRYCDDPLCMQSIYAWSNPQKDQGRLILLERQDYKCNICNYDWKLVSYWPEDRQPEVDHIVPISKGGQALGLDNHQAICKMCHKVKTKVDNSGPRKKRTK